MTTGTDERAKLVAEIDRMVAICADTRTCIEGDFSRLACFVRNKWPTLRAALSHQGAGDVVEGWQTHAGGKLDLHRRTLENPDGLE